MVIVLAILTASTPTSCHASSHKVPSFRKTNTLACLIFSYSRGKHTVAPLPTHIVLLPIFSLPLFFFFTTSSINWKSITTLYQSITPSEHPTCHILIITLNHAFP